MESSLKRRALTLGIANAIDYALQFILPAILARFLDPVQFGEYRVVWLVTASVAALTTFAIPQSLYYFLPRTPVGERKTYIYQALIFLACTGALGALAVASWNPLLPANVAALGRHGLIVPVFVALWVISYVLDMLPMAEERTGWQARSIVGLSLVRAGFLTAVAVLTQSVHWVLAALLLHAVIKVSLMIYYVSRYHGFLRGAIHAKTFVDQLRYAVPFGVSGLLYGWRAQADQWVAAALFSISQFGTFSVASAVTPLVNLFRQSVSHAFLPEMSRLQANGDLRPMLDLNARANASVAMLLFPMLGFVFAFAEPLITLVYTAAHADAAPVMRIYVVGLIGLTIEINSIMLVLRQGHVAMKINTLALILSVSLSYAGARMLGMPGAAIGSVAAIYLERVLTLRHVLAQTELSLGKSQVWRTLIGALLISAGSGVAALGCVEWLGATEHVFFQVATGGACYGLACFAGYHALGMGRQLRGLIGISWLARKAGLIKP